MKLSIIILCIACILMSCESSKKKVIPVKPFYIFDVGSHGAGNGHHWYKAVDSKGHEFEFVDTEGKYSIGDSIK